MQVATASNFKGGISQGQNLEGSIKLGAFPYCDSGSDIINSYDDSVSLLQPKEKKLLYKKFWEQPGVQRELRKKATAMLCHYIDNHGDWKEPDLRVDDLIMATYESMVNHKERWFDNELADMDEPNFTRMTVHRMRSVLKGEEHTRPDMLQRPTVIPDACWVSSTVLSTDDDNDEMDLTDRLQMDKWAQEQAEALDEYETIEDTINECKGMYCENGIPYTHYAAILCLLTQKIEDGTFTTDDMLVHLQGILGMTEAELRLTVHRAERDQHLAKLVIRGLHNPAEFIEKYHEITRSSWLLDDMIGILGIA